MSRRLKNKWLGARVDEGTYSNVDAYIEIAELSMGDLLRAAVEEYMINHPVKTPREPVVEQLRPGKEQPA